MRVRVASIAHPEARIPRFNRALAATLVPGCSAVPRADFVICLTGNFSNTTRCADWTSRCEVCSTQSFRRFTSLARTRFNASLVLVSRFDGAGPAPWALRVRRCRASCCSRRRRRFCSRANRSSRFPCFFAAVRAAAGSVLAGSGR